MLNTINIHQKYNSHVSGMTIFLYTKVYFWRRVSVLFPRLHHKFAVRDTITRYLLPCTSAINTLFPISFPGKVRTYFFDLSCVLSYLESFCVLIYNIFSLSTPQISCYSTQIFKYYLKNIVGQLEKYFKNLTRLL